MPRISVVTPLYNGERFIGQTVDSVLGQTTADWEYVAVDDGSTDMSPDIVACYARTDARIRMIRQVNAGVCNARNNGYAALSGDSKYVLFLDHDDVLEPNFLERLGGYLDDNPAVGVVYTSLKLIGTDGNAFPDVEWIRPRRYLPTWCGAYRIAPDTTAETSLPSLMAYFQCVPTSCLFRRSVYDRAGGWNEETGRMVYEDKDLVMRCALVSEVHLVNEYVARYRWHETNASHVKGQDYRRHYERRWLHCDFISSQQQRQIRHGIEFDRRLSGLFALASARDQLARGSLRDAVRDLARGVYRVATAPLARFGR
jgi:glycosyltransferase involved in cell wall biosynthesis